MNRTDHPLDLALLIMACTATKVILTIRVVINCRPLWLRAIRSEPTNEVPGVSSQKGDMA